MEKNSSRGRLVVAIVLLVLPVVYVGSYCALVTPRLDEWVSTNAGLQKIIPYRAGTPFLATAFWPLEQLDRRLRPNAWATIYFGPDGLSSGPLLPPPGGVTVSPPGLDPFAPQAPAPAPAP